MTTIDLDPLHLFCPLPAIGANVDRRCDRPIAQGRVEVHFPQGSPVKSIHYTCSGGHHGNLALSSWTQLEVAQAAAKSLAGDSKANLGALVEQRVAILIAGETADEAMLQLFEAARKAFEGIHKIVDPLAWQEYIDYWAALEMTAS